MDWKRPLVVLVAFGLVAWGIGAAVTLATTTLFDGALSVQAVVTLALIVVAVGVMTAVGRRSGEWTANPETYW